MRALHGASTVATFLATVLAVASRFDDSVLAVGLILVTATLATLSLMHLIRGSAPPRVEIVAAEVAVVGMIAVALLGVVSASWIYLAGLFVVSLRAALSAPHLARGRGEARGTPHRP